VSLANVARESQDNIAKLHMNGIPVPSGSSSLKRKHLSTKDHEPPPAKKLKKSKRAGETLEVTKQYKPSSKEKVKDKGKGKDHASGLEFKSVNARMTVTIPPLYSGPGRPRQAVLEMLDGMLMRFVYESALASSKWHLQIYPKPPGSSVSAF
jgi:hypothetical protein